MLKFLFKSKRPIIPEFNALEAYPMKDKYFIRTKPSDWLTPGQIYVAAKRNDKPTMITMEFWAQEIFLDADGQMTVSALIDTAAQQLIDSGKPVPANLDAGLIEELESLINDLKIVEFRAVKSELPENIALPMSKQSAW